MDKERVFNLLKKQPKSVLLDLLESAFDELKTSQRKWIFDDFAEQRPSAVDGEDLLQEIQAFERESLSGLYYAPFDINSKNYMDIPEETEAWFDRIGDLLKDSAKLTEKGEHALAVQCFDILYKLIETMEEGDEEIVFAEECGSWMIPCEKKDILASFIASMAATKSPEMFTASVLPLIRRDRIQSFSGKVYTSANRVASKEQRSHLKAELKRQDIPTGPKQAQLKSRSSST